MKKNPYLIVLLLIAITLSCKKEKEVPFPVSENIKMTKEGYYEIGSIIKDGKNVVHLPNNETSWLQTPPDAPGYPSLANGYYFQEDIVAESLNGTFFLKFQSDGNLVLYKRLPLIGPPYIPQKTATWASYGYNSSPGTKVRFQTDGNILSMNSAGTVYWASNKLSPSVGSPIWFLQNDGNLVGYTDHNRSGNGFFRIEGPPFACTRTNYDNVSPCLGYMCDPY